MVRARGLHVRQDHAGCTSGRIGRGRAWRDGADGNGGMRQMSTLEEWMTTVHGELALDGDGVADLRIVQQVILDLARDAAHGVARPAAPLTAYLVGVAVSPGASLPASVARIAALRA